MHANFASWNAHCPHLHTVHRSAYGSSKCVLARACVPSMFSFSYTIISLIYYFFFVFCCCFFTLSVCLFCYSLAVAGFDLLLSAIYSGLCGVLIFTILCVCVWIWKFTIVQCWFVTGIMSSMVMPLEILSKWNQKIQCMGQWKMSTQKRIAFKCIDWVRTHVPISIPIALEFVWMCFSFLLLFSLSLSFDFDIISVALLIGLCYLVFFPSNRSHAYVFFSSFFSC